MRGRRGFLRVGCGHGGGQSRRALPTRGNECISTSYRVHEKAANGLRPLADFNMHPQTRMSAAALSAAVNSHKLLVSVPILQAEPSKRNRTPPNASRSSGERGLGGEVLLSEKQPLPPEFLTRPSYNISSFDRRRRCAGSERASRLFRSWSGWGRCRDRPSRRALFARSRRLDAQRK